ncbi:MAG: LysR family transcriptional regulator, partial [Pseudorhodoplanes sp.]
MSIEICHLRYVVAAADYRSFRRAAAALNVTQPTLSKRIRELEDQLGLPLFERSTSGSQLTGEGEALVTSAKRILAELEYMQNHVKAVKVGTSGRLHIGIYTSLSTGALVDIVCGFAEQFENVDVNVVEDSRSSLISLLDRGAVDIIVVLGEPAYRDYAHTRLWSERIMVALHKEHPLVEREFVSWTDLKGERFLMGVQ